MTSADPRAATAPLQLAVMGVSGVGKSTLGEALAQRLGLPYADGDTFHSQAARDKMASGQPLDDQDRAPWLARIGAWLAEQERGAVVSCSALKRSYRDALRTAAPGLQCLHLSSDPARIAARMAARKGHYMPASLLQSQLDTLEPLASDERGVTLDVGDQQASALVDRALALLSAQAQQQQ